MMQSNSNLWNFDQLVNRKGTWCTQWDYVQDRFGEADLTPFTISDMDFEIASAIKKALMERINHGVLGYSRWQHSDYLNAISLWFKQQFNTSINTTDVVYGPSVIYMVAKLITLWSQKGDRVVVHTPAYDAFYKTIEGNGRIVDACPLNKQDNNWFCNMNYLESLLAKPKTKILLLCSPHNPTGKVWTKQELSEIAFLCEKHQVKVISDEIHMDMVWQGEHLPWSQFGKESWALFTSASKSFNIPALTGAYGIINGDDTKVNYLNQLKVNDGLSSPAVLSIVATIAAYEQSLPWLSDLKCYLKDNQHYVAEKLNSAFPEINYQIPESTYLAWLDLRDLNINDEQLQRCLIHQEKVAIMPGGTYGQEGKGFLRLNVGCPLSKLEIGVNGLINALSTIKMNKI